MILPETATPASEPFAGGNGASPCPTVRTLLAGAGALERSAAPIRTCSPLKRVPQICQLRLTFLRRKKTITGNRNSGESPVPRRKAPAPIKLAFAGAGACKRASAPIKTCSPLKRVPHSCQLRPTFLHRRKSITGNRNSGESPVRRKKAAAPIRIGFAGADVRMHSSAPIRIRSPKKSVP